MCTFGCRTCKSQPDCEGCSPKCCSPCISYCIFDLESAVFDTRHVYRKALKELVRCYDKRIPDILHVQSGPMTISEMSELFCRKLDIPMSWESFRYELNERTSHLIANPPFMDGIERLVPHLRNSCMELGLITSSNEANYCSKIRGREDFFENFSTVVCADDPELRAPKPEPDVYLIAMSRLGDAGPDCTLVFDGTPKGVQAASDARLPVIMLAEKDLPCCWSELATLRLETLEEFDPAEFNMPPYSCTEPPPKKPKASSHRSSQKSAASQRGSAALKKAAADSEADEGEEEEGEGQEVA